MIITITLNAALDRTLRIEQPLVVGKLNRRCQLSGTGRQGYQCFRAVKALGGGQRGVGFLCGYKRPYDERYADFCGYSP